MIKKILKLLMCVVLIVTMLTGCGESPAEDSDSTKEETPAEDLNYIIEENEVSVTGYMGSDDTIAIPEKIEGSKVTSVEIPWDDIEGVEKVILNENVDSFILENIKDVSEIDARGCENIELGYLFEDENEIDKLYVGDVSSVSIHLDPEEMAEYVSIKELHISDDVKEINLSVYIVDLETVVYGEKGSYAEEFAKENGYDFVNE